MADVSIPSDVLEAVAEISAELGKTLTIKRRALGALIDSAVPSKGKVVTTTSHKVSGLVMDFEMSKVDGEIIQTGDRMAIISLSGMTITPNTDDVLVDGSVTWKIQNVTLTEVSGVTCVCLLHLRK